MNDSPLRRTSAVLLLALAPAAVVTAWLVLRGDLPDPVATHWTLAGAADGFTDPALFVTVLSAVTAVIAVLGAVLLARGARRPLRPTIGALVWSGWFLAATGVGALLASRGLADAHDARYGPAGLALPLAVALAGAALAWLVLPADAPPAPAASVGTASYALGAQERAVWVGGAASRTLLVLCGVLLLVAAVLSVWEPLVALVVLLAALLMAWTHSLTVRVDDRGVSAHFGPLPGLGARVPLADVAAVRVEEIEPMRWGGWGYRRSTRGTALIVRGGPGLVLTRTGGQELALSVDDPRGAAELVAALLARSAR